MDDLRLDKYDLKPGDVFVVKARGKLSAQQASRIRQAIAPELPDGVRLLVVDDSVRVAVLTKGEIEARVGKGV